MRGKSEIITTRKEVKNTTTKNVDGDSEAHVIIWASIASSGKLSTHKAQGNKWSQRHLWGLFFSVMCSEREKSHRVYGSSYTHELIWPETTSNEMEIVSFNISIVVAYWYSCNGSKWKTNSFILSKSTTAERNAEKNYPALANFRNWLWGIFSAQNLTGPIFIHFIFGYKHTHTSKRIFASYLDVSSSVNIFHVWCCVTRFHSTKIITLLTARSSSCSYRVENVMFRLLFVFIHVKTYDFQRARFTRLHKISFHIP